MTNKNNNKGFTLVELLCTIVIVLLLTSCITLGIGLATKVFDKNLKSTKAQTLASTLNYLISDELRTATGPKIKEDGLHYVSDNFGSDATMNVGETEGKNLGRIIVDNHNKPGEDLYNEAGNVYALGTSQLYGDKDRSWELHVAKDDAGDKVKGFKVELDKDKNVFIVEYSIVEYDKLQKTQSDTPLATSRFEVKSMDGSNSSPAGE